MKLNIEPRRRVRVKTIEVLHTRENELQSDFFDPRVDLPPGELEGYVELAKGGQIQDHDQKRQLYSAAWVSWVYPEYAQHLKVIPGLEEFWTEQLEQQLKTSPASPHQLSRFFEAAGLFQIFPEARQRIQFSNQAFWGAVAETNRRTEKATKFEPASALIQVAPEKRSQIIEKVLGSKEAAFKALEGCSDTLSITGSFLLIFPEYHKQVLSMIHPKKQAMLDRVKQTKTQPGILDFEAAQRMFRWMTIIGSEDACIDETGQVQVKLKPLKRPLVVNTALPDRPQV